MLRYGVLGFLIERRGYGYDLVQRLSTRLGAAWQLTPSAVYTALDQLEEGGLIEAVSDGCDLEESGAAELERVEGGERASPRRRTPRRSERVIYRPTSHGVAEFQAWLARPSARIDPIRSELQLKVALAGPDQLSSLLATLTHEQALIARRIDETFLAATEEQERSGGRALVSRLRAVMEAPTGSSWPLAADALVSAAAGMRLQADLVWLEAVRETLQQLNMRNTSASLSAARIG